jgi:predicted DNA-binding transcriptional regulator YafY
MMNPLSTTGPSSTFPNNGAPLGELRAAIRSQARLDITYEDEHGRRTQRVVWPVQLSFMDRARVLAAWYDLRQDFRTFRTDRILMMTPLGSYPGRRADLARRLRAHFDGLSSRQVS